MDWQHQGRSLRFFENAENVLVCGGIGARHARQATESIIQLYKPDVVISTGFAGALVPESKVGDLAMPRWVIDAKDGSRHDTGSWRRSVVDSTQAQSRARKRSWDSSYGAQVVDMEAAAVAKGAVARGIRFAAVKVITDELDFAMPPVERFVDDAGLFQTARFVAHAAVRPWLWKSVVKLGRNSSVASEILCKALINESVFGIAASNVHKS